MTSRKLNRAAQAKANKAQRKAAKRQPQCAHVTASGNRCKRTISTGTGRYCAQHFAAKEKAAQKRAANAVRDHAHRKAVVEGCKGIETSEATYREAIDKAAIFYNGQWTEACGLAKVSWPTLAKLRTRLKRDAKGVRAELGLNEAQMETVAKAVASIENVRRKIQADAQIAKLGNIDRPWSDIRVACDKAWLAEQTPKAAKKAAKAPSKAQVKAAQVKDTERKLSNALATAYRLAYQLEAIAVDGSPKQEAASKARQGVAKACIAQDIRTIGKDAEKGWHKVTAD